MDKGLCLSQEPGGRRSSSDSDIFRVEYRELETGDWWRFFDALTEFWYRVNGEDLSKPYTGSRIDGRQISMAEAKLYHFQYERCRIQLATFRTGEIAGFLVYHMAYNCVLAVEALYVTPGNENRGVGKGLLESLGKPVRKIFFQTHVSNPPSRFLKLIEGRNLSKLHQEGDLISWEMSWDPKGGE